MCLKKTAEMTKQRRQPELIMVTLTIMMSIVATFVVASPATNESLMGGHLDNQATTHEDDANSPLRYRIANVVPFAFNGGQPFSLEKDPVTGQIDFDKAPPLKALNYTGSYQANNDDEQHDADESQQISNKESENEYENNNNNSNNNYHKDNFDLLASLNDENTDDEDQQIPNEINPYSPSFHDFLHLPVRYSNHEKYMSDKYPLISNSYANTKVQGGSKTYNVNTINHKNYHHGGEASTSQSYSMTRKPFVPRTTTSTTTTTTTTTRSPIIATTMKPFIRRITTTKKPITTTTARKPTTTSAPTTTTTQAPTTTTTQKPTTTTITTTTTTMTTPKPMMTTPVTTWKPAKNDRYDNDYTGAILPIEKIQNSEGSEYQADQIFGISDMNGYDDNYEDYAPLEFTPSASTSTTTTMSPPITTTLATTTTTTSTTTTTIPPSLPITSMPLDPMTNNPGDSNGIIRPMQGAVNINVGYNDYLNHPVNNPSYSGLVVESASNVIVPPDQDTISFVLGNRQNIDGSYYAQGSAIPESPYNDMNPVQPSQIGHSDMSVNLHQHQHQRPRPYSHQHSHEDQHKHPQHPLIQENVRPMKHDIEQKWWFNSEQSEKSQSVIEKTKDDKINVVAGYRVVFPTSAPEISTTFEDITSTIPSTISPSSSSIIPVMSNGLSELSEILTPPAIDGAPTRPALFPAQRPPLHYPPHHHYHQSRPEMPTRIQRPPLLPNGNGYKIRPLHVDINLPNILPQFRPNVKTSQRRGSEAIGTMIIPSSPKYPPRVSMRPPPPPPPPPPSQHRLPQRRPPVSHLQRLNPPPPPPPVHALRLPAPAALIGAPNNRKTAENIPLQNEIPPLHRNVIGVEGQLDERNRSPSASNQILKSRLNDEDTDKITSESLGMPPRAPLFPKRKIGNSSVATLQMIQQHQVQTDIVTDDKVIISDDNDNNDDENENHNETNRRVDESPVYVVYPVKGSMDIRPDIDDSLEKEPMDESVVIGIHGPQRPLPPETLSQQNNDDNEDNNVNIALVRGPVRLASDFPYPPAIPNPSLFISQLQEKPLLVPNQHHRHHTQENDNKDSLTVNQQDRDTNINVIPYLQDHQPFPLKQNVISTTLQLFGGGSQSSSSSSSSSSSLSSLSSSSPSPLGSTVTPIAYVYTPTTRTLQRRPIEPFERNPVLLPSQQPSSSSSSAPSPQNFMAPFVASISAETPSKNGWSVVTGGPFLSKPNESSDKIDRDDNVNDDENDNERKNDFHDRIDTYERNKNASNESYNDRNDYNNNENDSHNEEKVETSESSGALTNGENFDVDNFKPQLFGGFQPIFEFPSDNDESPNERKPTETMTMMEEPRVAKDSGA